MYHQKSVGSDTLTDNLGGFMLPSIVGYVSANDLISYLSGSPGPVTIHQLEESLAEEPYCNQAPFIQMSFQMVPGTALKTDIIAERDPAGNLLGPVRRVILTRVEQSIIQPGK